MEDYKDSVDYVVQLLKKHLADGRIKMFYPGDPDVIPTFNLPAVIVTKSGDGAEPGTNVQDDVTESLVVKLVLDKKHDWANNLDPDQVSETKLRDWMEGRDRETGQWRRDTIRGALRAELHESQPYVGETTSLEYGVNVRPGANEDLLVAEAHLTIQVTYSVDIDQVFN